MPSKAPLTARALAKRYGVTPETIRLWVAAGRLPAPIDRVHQPIGAPAAIFDPEQVAAVEPALLARLEWVRRGKLRAQASQSEQPNDSGFLS